MHPPGPHKDSWRPDSGDRRGIPNFLPCSRLEFLPVLKVRTPGYPGTARRNSCTGTRTISSTMYLKQEFQGIPRNF
eukprot:2523915-Rhodomonas_salina.1